MQAAVTGGCEAIKPRRWRPASPLQVHEMPPVSAFSAPSAHWFGPESENWPVSSGPLFGYRQDYKWRYPCPCCSVLLLAVPRLQQVTILVLPPGTKHLRGHHLSPVARVSNYFQLHLHRPHSLIPQTSNRVPGRLVGSRVTKQPSLESGATRPSTASISASIATTPTKRASLVRGP